MARRPAEMFVFTGLSGAQAATIATEALTLLPSTFSLTPDHYWLLLSERRGCDWRQQYDVWRIAFV